MHFQLNRKWKSRSNDVEMSVPRLTRYFWWSGVGPPGSHMSLFFFIEWGGGAEGGSWKGYGERIGRGAEASPTSC